MKMAKFLVGMLMAVLLTGSIWATEADQNVNPLTVARAFALKTPNNYRCFLWCEMLMSKEWKPIRMEFVMAKDFGITSLSVNGEAVQLDEPIHGLPMGDGGLMRNVYLHANAMTKTGEYAGNGYVQKEIVSKNDLLTVVVRPADIRQEIPIANIEQYGNDLRLNIDGLGEYGWGIDSGCFYAYFPPVGGRYHYTVCLPDGTVIAEGWLEPFQPVEMEKDTYLGIDYLGNVQGVEFQNQEGLDDWVGVSNLKFDCLIPTDDGGQVNGKVIFTDVGLGDLDIILSGEYWIYVQSAVSEGDMPFLELADHSANYDGWVQTRVSTISGNVGKVVITIIPKPTNTINNPWLNLHRFYGSLWIDGGKG